MQKRRKIVMVSVGFPYGRYEPFLHNEILYLSKHFEVEVFPIVKNFQGIGPTILPDDIVVNRPFLKKNYLRRVVNGLFNRSPIYPYIKDFIPIIRNPNHFKKKFMLWFLNLLTFRTIFSSKCFNASIKDPSTIIYFYWCNMPIGLIKGLTQDIFIRVHGGEVDLERNFGYIPLLKYKIIQKANIHYLPISIKASDYFKDFASSNYSINRLGVCDNGLNPSSGSNATITIVSCSNLKQIKRDHLIVEALSSIYNRQVEWIHFGDGPLFSNIFELSKNILPNNIEFKMMGWVRNSEILNYYARKHIDLFVNVSEAEGIPVSIMEAFSFGIPCFATNVGGTGEIVNNENGYLAPKDFSIKDLSAFIEDIRVISKKKSLRENARYTWSKICNAEVNYSRLVQRFEKNSY